MATFTEVQITDLAEILATNSDALAYHLDGVELLITESDKTRVLELVTEWQAISTSAAVISIEPKDRNFGVRMNAGSQDSDIAYRISTLLQFPITNGYGNHSLVRA